MFQSWYFPRLQEQTKRLESLNCVNWCNKWDKNGIDFPTAVLGAKIRGAPGDTDVRRALPI